MEDGADSGGCLCGSHVFREVFTTVVYSGTVTANGTKYNLHVHIYMANLILWGRLIR